MKKQKLQSLQSLKVPALQKKAKELGAQDISGIKKQELIKLIYELQVNSIQKLLDLRHSDLIEVASYTHSSLKHSHTCVDLLQVKGAAGNIRFVIEDLQNTQHVDKVSFVLAPMRDDGCC